MPVTKVNYHIFAFISFFSFYIVPINFHIPNTQLNHDSSKNNYICPLCNKILKRKDSSIQSDLCEEWIHLFKCSLLTTDDFEFLLHTENKWHCSKCTPETLPFHDINDNDLFIVNLGIDCNSYPNLSFISRSSNDFITDCQNLLNNPSDKILNEQEDEFYAQINSQYYIFEFNQISHNQEFSFNLLHTNLASISKHCDELQLTLSLLKTKLDVIGITEHKIQKENIASTTNIEIPGFILLCLTAQILLTVGQVSI